jgi:hypothetical protein
VRVVEALEGCPPTLPFKRNPNTGSTEILRR